MIYMKILLVISSMGIGGEQRAASIITDYFIKAGNYVEIITFNSRNNKQIAFNEKINIEVSDKSKKNLYRLNSIRQKIKQNKFDIVIGFAVIPSILCSLAAIGLNIPVVVCERNDPGVYSKLWKIVRSVSYRFASGAVFQTSDASRYFSESYFKTRTVIKNPIHTNIKKYRKPVEKRKKIVVNTSRLTDVKNQDQIIRAFSKVYKKYGDYRLELYGDGECRQSLENLIEQLHLENAVAIYNATEFIFDKISDSEIFVLTSSHEGFPNSLAEAMALGLAVISVDCRIGGPKDMILDNVNGKLIPLNDEDALVRAMDELMGNDSKRIKLSKTAMQIADELSAEVIGKKWVDYLQKVIDRHMMK